MTRYLIQLPSFWVPSLIRSSYNTSRLSQRAQLFPEDRYDGSRSSSPSLRAAQQGYNTTSNRFDSQIMDTLESQNDDMLESLSSKVKILKNVRPPTFPTRYKTLLPRPLPIRARMWLMEGDCQNRRRNSGFIEFNGYNGKLREEEVDRERDWL